MSRNILMLVPALAFALPFVATQPTMARPLATEAPHVFDGDDDDDDNKDDDDDDGGGDETLFLTVCFETQIAVETDDRAYSCDIVQGPSCFSSCTAAAVAPLCETQLGLGARSGDILACQEQRLEQCRSQCEDGGAAFCSDKSDLKARGKHDDDDDDHDDDDDDNKGDDVVFIDIEVCVDLELDLDNL